jgi:carboxyl-terminal processing protease
MNFTILRGSGRMKCPSKMIKRKVFIFILFVCVLILVPAQDEDVWNLSLKKLSSIVALLEENYYQELDEEELIFSSVKGMIQTLDPHSYFLEPSHFSRLREEHAGKYYGLGILIQKQEDRLVVISPIEGGPAFRLGIQAGDVISHINGESTKPISSYEAMQKLRGPKGTEVTITIVREGLEEPFDLTIVREEISLHSVPYAFMLKDDVGYIFIRNFSSTTTKEFEEKMEYLAKQGMKKLILDLRGNGGGTFFQSIEISDEFLHKGAPVVSIKGRNKYYDRDFNALHSNQYEDIPLVILIDRGSASAPEILSGAIKDNDRGLIVGEDSWGKGLVQTVFPLASNIALALTTAEYFTPSGRSIQRDYSSLEDYILKREVSEEKREVRYTAKGRKVLGQGGISPDYTVKFSNQPLTSRLFFKGAFFLYGRQFATQKKALSRELQPFPEKQGQPNPHSIIDERILLDFVDYLKKSGIEFKKEEFEKASEEIKRELAREIFSSLWGMEEGVKVYRRTDPVVLKAIEVLPEAKGLLSD